MENTFISMVDHKKEAKFWIEALSNENITRKNKELINKVLEIELNSYLAPSFNISISPVEAIEDALKGTVWKL